MLPCYTLLDLHNSSDDTQPHSIIANYEHYAEIILSNMLEWTEGGGETR